jgi:FAD/FMN-containing dehydrogenase
MDNRPAVSQLREIGSTRTPFAIKCSGHTSNPGFSSTPGVQISMTRFRDIVLNEEEETVEIGAGLTWTEVFSYLVPKGLNVVGGRIDGVGVAGFILGGGRHSSSLPRIHHVFSCLYLRGRVFLEDQSVWPHNRYCH